MSFIADIATTPALALPVGTADNQTYNLVFQNANSTTRSVASLAQTLPRKLVIAHSSRNIQLQRASDARNKLIVRMDRHVVRLDRALDPTSIDGYDPDNKYGAAVWLVVEHPKGGVGLTAQMLTDMMLLIAGRLAPATNEGMTKLLNGES